MPNLLMSEQRSKEPQTAALLVTSILAVCVCEVKVRGFVSVYETLISYVFFTIYVIAACFGHTTIFKHAHIC
jgi:hypothetical protein